MSQLRVLIVRLSAIGDVIHTMPLACALRDAWPDMLLTWVVEDRGGALLRGHRAIDELIEVPRGFLKSPVGVWRLRRRLRDRGFNLAIDAQGLTKSALVAWLSGAKRRIGFGEPFGREISRWFQTEVVDTPRMHAVDRMLQLLRPLGIQPAIVRFDVPELPPERSFAETALQQAGLRRNGFALVTPGAGWASKLWMVGRFAAVTRHLGSRWNLPSLVIWGNERERDWAEQIAADADGHARLAPKMSLMQLAALQRRARLFVGADTGPLHLAAALGTPCVGLYGPWPADMYGPYGPQHIAVQKMCLDGSTWQRRHAPSKYMDAIDVETVAAACDQILGRPRTEAA
jgi:heptosyltransferase I